MRGRAKWTIHTNKEFVTRNTDNKTGIQVHNTIQNLHMAPKDKDNMCQKSVVIYHYKLSHTNCPEQYIGKSGRTSSDRFREHLRAPFPIHLQSDHRTSGGSGMLHHI